ncbi:MAG: ParA family protein [Succinivibrio sp.]|nr:ParA family protein [Succinivibrio sp.]
MKTLCIANEKGGVGKTLLATQIALYIYKKCGLRVLFIDLDQQANATKILQGTNPYFTTHTLQFTASELFARTLDIQQALLKDCSNREAGLTLVAADPNLAELERASANNLITLKQNFTQALAALYPHFDLCILDTNPSPDIRANLGLLFCTHLLSPIEFARESIDGIVNLLERINGVAIRNPHLRHGFLGLLPNKVDTTSIQKLYFEQLIKKVGRLFLKGKADLPILEGSGQGAARLKRDEQGVPLLEPKDFFCLLKDHAAFREAQGFSLPIWCVSGVQQAWSEFKRLAFTVYERLDFPSRLDAYTKAGQGAAAFSVTTEKDATSEQALIRRALQNSPQLGATLQQLYSKAAYLMLRQFLLSDNPAVLPGISPAQIQDLRVLRTQLALRDFVTLVTDPAKFSVMTEKLGCAA